jgi:hypothetical protein
MLLFLLRALLTPPLPPPLLGQVLHGAGRWSSGPMTKMRDAVPTGCCCSCTPRAQKGKH